MCGERAYTLVARRRGGGCWMAGCAWSTPGSGASGVRSSPNSLLGRNERAAGDRVSARVAHGAGSNIEHFEGFAGAARLAWGHACCHRSHGVMRVRCWCLGVVVQSCCGPWARELCRKGAERSAIRRYVLCAASDTMIDRGTSLISDASVFTEVEVSAGRRRDRNRRERDVRPAQK